MTKEDFRVKEYNGSFTIEREFEIEIVTYRWFRKTLRSKEKRWKAVNRRGGNVHISLGDYSLPPFKTLQDALDMIDVIVAGDKYHYPKETIDAVKSAVD